MSAAVSVARRAGLRWAGTALIPLAFGVATIVLQSASGVTMFEDELGFLGEAVWFSGRSGDPILRGAPFYSAGYPLLLALPLSLVPVDPWLVAVGANLALLAALGPVLHHTVRRALPVSDAVAFGAAVAGACVPAVVLQVPRAWSELAFTFGFAVWSALLLRFSRIGPLRGGIPVALSAALLVSLHRRATVVVLLTLAVLVVAALREGLSRAEGRDLRAVLSRTPWRPAATSVAVGGLALAGVLALDAVVVHDLYQGITSGSRLDKVENLTSMIWGPTLLGHVWTLLATSFGLAGVGLVALGWLVRQRRDLWATTIVLAVLGVLATSVIFLAAGSRADQLVYERYLSPTTPVLVTVAVACLAARIGPVLIAAAGSVAVLVGGGAVLANRYEDDRLVGAVQKFTVPALTSLDLPTVGWGEAFPTRIHVGPITVLAVVAAVAVVLVTRWRPAGAAGVIAAWAAFVAIGSAGNLRPFVTVWQPTGREAAALLDSGETLQYEPSTRHETRNVLHYRLDYRRAVPVDPASCPPEPLFVGPRKLSERFDVVERRQVQGLPGAIYEAGC